MSLVENIKSLCELRGMSIPKLEKELGFGRGSIYNWEKSSPSIDKVQKVAEFFNVSVNRVLHGFDADRFSNMVNLARGDRTITEFAKVTGIDHNELLRICLGGKYERPSMDTVRKIASNNQHGLLFEEDDFLEAAGYISERQGDAIRQKIIDELVDEFGEAGFTIQFENDDDVCRVHISHEDYGYISTMYIHRFIENGFDLLEELKQKYKQEDDIQTIAAHHDGEDWTEEELQEIEEFKQYVKMRRLMRKNNEE